MSDIKSKLDELLGDSIVDDRPRYADTTVVPIKDMAFERNSLTLPTRPFTDEEVAAARAATEGAEEED